MPGLRKGKESPSQSRGGPLSEMTTKTSKGGFLKEGDLIFRCFIEVSEGVDFWADYRRVIGDVRSHYLGRVAGPRGCLSV